MFAPFGGKKSRNTNWISSLVEGSGRMLIGKKIDRFYILAIGYDMFPFSETNPY